MALCSRACRLVASRSAPASSVKYLCVQGAEEGVSGRDRDRDGDGETDRQRDRETERETKRHLYLRPQCAHSSVLVQCAHLVVAHIPSTRAHGFELTAVIAEVSAGYAHAGIWVVQQHLPSRSREQ